MGTKPTTEEEKKKKPVEKSPPSAPKKEEGKKGTVYKETSLNRPSPRGFFESLGDGAKAMASPSGEGLNAFLGRGLNSTLNDLLPDSSFAHNPDNQFSQEYIKGKAAQERDYLYGRGGVTAAREQRAGRAADDYTEDPSYWGQTKRYTGDLVGGIIGDVNPTYFSKTPAGLTNRLMGAGVSKTLAKPLANILTQGFLGGATDAIVQGGEMAQGIQKDFDPGRMWMNTLAGMVFQGTGEAAGPLAGLLGRKFKTPEMGLPERHGGVGALNGSFHSFNQSKIASLEYIDPKELFDIARENGGYLLVQDGDSGKPTKQVPFTYKMAEDWAQSHNAYVGQQKSAAGKGRLEDFDGVRIADAPTPDVPVVGETIVVKGKKPREADLSKQYDGAEKDFFDLNAKGGEVSPEDLAVAEQTMLAKAEEFAKNASNETIARELKNPAASAEGNNNALYNAFREEKARRESARTAALNLAKTRQGEKVRGGLERQPLPVRDPGVTPEPTKRELVRAERVKKLQDTVTEKNRVHTAFLERAANTRVKPDKRAQAAKEAEEIGAELAANSKKLAANLSDPELKRLYDEAQSRGDSPSILDEKVIQEYNKRQEPPVVLDDVLTKLTGVLKGTKKTSAEQRENVSRFRKEQYRKLSEAQRYSTGAAGLAREKAALKGQADQATPGAIRGKFSDKEIDVLHNALKNSDSLSKSPYDKVNARDALDKILDEGIPTAREIDLIERAIRSASATPVKPSTAKVVPIKFMRDGKRVKLNIEDLTEKELAKALRQNTRPGATVVNQFTVNELVSTLRGKRDTTDKVIEFMENFIGIARSVVSTADLSAPLRQGVFMIGRKEFYTALPNMFKEFAENFKNHDEFILSDMNANWKPSTSKVLDDIRQMPRYDEMMEVELAITDPHSKIAANREESFQTPWAEKVPLLGRVAKGSNAAYSAFLNKLRADVYNDIVSRAETLGELSFKEKRDIARYINSATGRGDLKYFDDKVEFLQKGAGILNATLFSPRLNQARVNLLNIAFYARLSPVAQREAFKDLAKFSTIAGSVLTLAALAGADIETDSRSSDFLKIKVGNTRYDILGGFGQFIVLASRGITGERKTGRGDYKALDGEGNNDTFGNTLVDFSRSKLAPVPAYVVNSLLKENVIGEETNWTKGAIQMMFPLFVQGLADAYKEEGMAGAAKTLPSFFGVGVNTYDSGLDRFGRVPTSKEETDPTVLALEELAPNGMDSLFGYVDKGDLDAFAATDEDVKAYQELSGKYIMEYMTELIKTPEWAEMTNEERVKEVKAVAKDMRLYAREDLFPEYYSPEDDLPPEDPEDEDLIEDTPVEGDAPPEAPSGGGHYQSGIQPNTVSPYVLAIFPDAVVTSTARGEDHPLTKANPGSAHYRDGQFTVDIKPIPGWTYEEVVKEFNRQGLDIAYSKNEVGSGQSGHATGDHWHFEFVGWEE